METGKPRLARLTAILTQLQSKRIVTATELAKKHQVSTRTIYRDIRTLEQSGIPIVTEEGKGYSILEGYHLPPVMFTEAEAQALLIAEKIMLQNKDQSLTEQYEKAITKIKSVLKGKQQEKTDFLAQRIQVRNNPKQQKTSNYLIQLQSTIAHFQVVNIAYLSLSNHHSQRAIEPFALYTTKENWILIAFCRNKLDFRAFRLDCIQNLQVTSEHFEPHQKTLEEYLQECRQKWRCTPDIPLSPSADIFASNQNNCKMQPVTINPFHLIGIEVRTTNENGQAAKDIGALWQRFMSQKLVEKIPNQTEHMIYSLYTDYEGDHTQPYTAILGCQVSSLADIPKGMIGRTFDGGQYVKLTARGDLQKGMIVDQWSKIWKMNLNRRFTADFEAFGPKSHNPEDAEVDFFVAVHE